MAIIIAVFIAGYVTQKYYCRSGAYKSIMYSMIFAIITAVPLALYNLSSACAIYGGRNYVNAKIRETWGKARECNKIIAGYNVTDTTCNDYLSNAYPSLGASGIDPFSYGSKESFWYLRNHAGRHIISRGPDRILNDYSNAQAHLSYDPTNGIYSKGDLIYHNPR